MYCLAIVIALYELSLAEVDQASCGLMDTETSIRLRLAAAGFLGLARAVGLCWKTLASSIPNVIHVGCSDTNDDEKRLFDQAGVCVITAELVNQKDLPEMLGPALNRMWTCVETIICEPGKSLYSRQDGELETPQYQEAP